MSSFAAPASTLSAWLCSASLSGAITASGEASSCASVAIERPFTSSSSLVIITTTDGCGFLSEIDSGIEMFLVFGSTSTSDVCTSRNTTRIVSMSMNGTSVMWLPPSTLLLRLRWRLMR